MKDMNKVGPFSKQIMNYSYPPLLYQRGDDSEEEGDMGEEEEEDSDSAGQYNLDGDDFNMDNLMGQDLDDLDQNNADLKQQEQVIDGLFAQENNQKYDSPDGIENVDISDIQNMINKSSESPALENDAQEMLNNMDFNKNLEKDELDFYNNL